MKVVIKFKNGDLKKYNNIKIFEIGLKLIHLTDMDGERKTIHKNNVKWTKQTQL